MLYDDRIIDSKLIVFESNPDFSDNARGLWEYIVRNTEYKTFWVVYDSRILDILREEHIDCAMLDSEEAQKMIAKAQFLVTSGFALAYRKRYGQIHVSLWHGFGLKVSGFFESATRDVRALEGLQVQTMQTDMLAVPSRLAKLVIGGVFALDPRKVKETGYPRNDIMLVSDAKKEIKKLVDIEADTTRLFFYLPTMRKGLKAEGEQFSSNIFNYPDYDANEIDAFLEEQHAYIIAKVHFADDDLYSKENFVLPRRMLFLDTYALTEKLLTIYHIMDAFDVLITDYSSVYTDFLLLDKPIIFSCPDIEKYQQDRGFITDDPELLMPGSICKTQGQLLDALGEVVKGKDAYREMRESHISTFHRYCDAHSSERVLAEMEKIYRDESLPDANKAPFYLNPFTQLYPFTRLGRAEIFFDYGDGFSEENKQIRKYDFFAVNDECMQVKFVLQLTADIKGLRFDPEDTERWIIKDFKVMMDGKELPFAPVNYYEVDRYLIPENSDPQIHIDISGKSAGEVIIQYECMDVLTNEREIIREREEVIFRKNKEIQKIKNSLSWKITKPLRNTKRRAKRILKN